MAIIGIQSWLLTSKARMVVVALALSCTILDRMTHREHCRGFRVVVNEHLPPAEREAQQRSPPVPGGAVDCNVAAVSCGLQQPVLRVGSSQLTTVAHILLLLVGCQ